MHTKIPTLQIALYFLRQPILRVQGAIRPLGLMDGQIFIILTGFESE